MLKSKQIIFINNNTMEKNTNSDFDYSLLENQKRFDELSTWVKSRLINNAWDEAIEINKDKILSTLENKARVEWIISSIDLNWENEEKEKPSVIISDFWAEEFKYLEDQFDTEKVEWLGIVAVVRCWNKSEADLIEFLKKVQKFKKTMPDLKGLFISINNNWEKDNVTESNLQKAMKVVQIGIPIVPIGINGYSWTAWLNAPTALINQICIWQNVDIEKIRVMNLSFGVDITDEELKKCNENIHNNRYTLTARNTSDGANPFSKNENGTQLWKKFKEIMRYPNETDLAELAYTMRNTFNIIPLCDIINLWGFNPLCNGESREFSTNQPNPFFNHTGNSRETKVTIRGMEDAEFFMRLILSALKIGKMEIIKQLRVSMDNPIFYDDKDWNRMHELNKIKKIGNEMTALSLIISWLATKESISTWRAGERKTRGLIKGMSVPKVMQDFYLRKE